MAVDASRTVRITFVAEDQNVGAVLKSVDGRLRDVKGRFVSAGKEAELFGETARRAGRAAATGFGRVRAEAKSAQAAIRASVKSAQAFVKGLKDVGLIGLGFSQIASFAREAVQALDELATEALEVQQVSRNLAFGIDEAAKSTEGFVDNMTLARNANKAFALGVASDSAEFASLVGAANKIAQAQGISAQKLVEQAVVGIGRKSAARLDDLGILLDQNKAERIYAKSLNKTAGELSILEKEEAFQKAALIEIKKAGDRAASSIDGFAVTVAKGKIELQNAKQEFQGFDDTIGKVRESMRGLSDEELERLRFGEVADDASAAGRELNEVLSEWGVNLRDVRGVADDLGVSFQDLVKGQQELREVQAVESTIKGLETINQAQIKGLEAQADEAEHLAKLGAAQGASEKLTALRMREALELRRDAAELQFLQTQSAKDETALLTAQRDLEIAAATKRKGGGTGPSRAERVLAQGEQRVAMIEHEADLASILATTEAGRFAAQEVAFDAARERIALENEALEATRARGKFSRLELDNKSAALELELEILDAQQETAGQERVNELVAEAVSIETARSEIEARAAARRFDLLAQEEGARAAAGAAGLEGEARRLDLAGRSFEAEQLRAHAEAQIAQARIFALEKEFSAREVLRQQRELELQANPPEDEIARIEQADALAALAHEREMDRRERDADAASARAELAERHHAEELRRIEEKKRKQKAALDATSRFMSTGQQFASAVIGAAIKDEEKRAQAELKARGVMAIATGALETVRAAASFASFNVVEGALHTAAAALAFTQGGIMLSGNIPGRGSAGGGAEAAATAPRTDRETGEAARIVESLPAADREPRQQPTTGQQGGGNVTTIENLNVTGAIDADTIEKVRLGLDNVNNGLEAAG